MEDLESSQRDLLTFKSTVSNKGYGWESGDGDLFLLDRARITLDWDSPGTLLTRNPLFDRTLYRTFANLILESRLEDRILDFANLNGMLQNNNYTVGNKESLEFWKIEIAKMFVGLNLWTNLSLSKNNDAFVAGQAKRWLEENITIERTSCTAQCKYGPFELWMIQPGEDGIPLSVFRDKEPFLVVDQSYPGLADNFFTSGPLRDFYFIDEVFRGKGIDYEVLGWLLLQQLINSQLQYGPSFRLCYEPENKKSRVYAVPETLLSGLWIQFALAASTVQLKQCLICGELISTDRKLPQKTKYSSTKTCSVRCRQEKHRILQAIKRFKASGLSITKISKRLGKSRDLVSYLEQEEPYRKVRKRSISTRSLIKKGSNENRVKTVNRKEYWGVLDGSINRRKEQRKRTQRRKK